jgi:hypothetical protein
MRMTYSVISSMLSKTSSPGCSPLRRKACNGLSGRYLISSSQAFTSPPPGGNRNTGNLEPVAENVITTLVLLDMESFNNSSSRASTVSTPKRIVIGIGIFKANLSSSECFNRSIARLSRPPLGRTSSKGVFPSRRRLWSHKNVWRTAIISFWVCVSRGGPWEASCKAILMIRQGCTSHNRTGGQKC